MHEQSPDLKTCNVLDCKCAKRPDEAFVGGRIVCYPIEHDFLPTLNGEDRPILFCRKCGTTQNL